METLQRGARFAGTRQVARRRTRSVPGRGRPHGRYAGRKAEYFYDYAGQDPINSYDLSGLSMGVGGRMEDAGSGDAILEARLFEDEYLQETRTVRGSSGSLAPRYPSNDGFFGEATPTHLSPGTVIDRYGGPGGKYASPAGTPFEMRGLPSTSRIEPPKTYVVVKPLQVHEGFAAPWADSPGLGVQYKLPLPVEVLIRRGFLREVHP